MLFHADFILYCVYQLEPGAESSNNVNKDLSLRRNCFNLDLLMNIYRLILQVKFMTAASYMLSRLQSFFIMYCCLSISQPAV